MPTEAPIGFVHDIPHYGAHAANYARYRPDYPDRIYHRLLEHLGDHRQEAVDLGAGTGQATASLLNWFDHVVAIEPDAEMAHEIHPHTKLDVRVSKAEDMNLPDQSVDAVICATSFHWFDGERVCQKVASWLKPGGVFLVFGYGQPQYHGLSVAASNLLRDMNAAWRNHVPRQLVDWLPYDLSLSESRRFVGIESYECYVDYHWTSEEVFGFLSTTSYASAFLKNQSDPDRYLAEQVHNLDALVNGDTIRLRFPVEIALARIASA